MPVILRGSRVNPSVLTYDISQVEAAIKKNVVKDFYFKTV